MRYQKILYLLFVLAMLLPGIQYFTGFMKERKLDGYYIPLEKPVLNKNNFFTSGFQPALEKYVNDNFGFRNALVRLHNQFYFSVLSQTTNPDYYVARDGMLFERRYIDAYFGNDLITENWMRYLADDIKKLQDTLAARKVTLLTIIAPSKAYYYPEFIPAEFDLTPGNLNTNYSYFKEYATGNKINLIDFNSWFIKMKSSTKFPLYSYNGTHWSLYGESLAFDSLLKKLTNLTGRQFPTMETPYLPFQVDADNMDYDVASILNMMYVKQEKNLVIPNSNFKIPPEGKPKVLGITDSYYGIWYYTGFLEKCFDSPDYWFGYTDLAPHDKYDKMGKKEDILIPELLDHEVVVLMCTPHNLRDLSWGAVEDALKYFDKTSEHPYKYDYGYNKRLESTRFNISHDVNWYEAILNQAKKEHWDTDTLFMKNLFMNTK